MALAERAELVATLSLQDKFSATARKATGALKGLETRVGAMGKGFNTIGKGIGTAIRNGTTLAIAGIGALTGLIALSVKEGQEAAETQQIYAKAIENSGKVSKAYVGILNAQQEALMDLAGVDDELIKSTQTQLILMGATGKEVAKLTPLILDMSKATGKDLNVVTLAVGKALNGNIGGLSRYGVVLDKTRVKQVGPFVAVMEALEQKFGGTTKALSGNLDTRLGVLRERMANIREEIGIKLLPSLTRIVDVVGRSLVPAFGKFVDRILPSISSGIDSFASALEGGGAESAINGIADALGSVLDVVKLLAAPAKMIVGAFLSLPKELQTIIIGGLAVNKLSGGLIGQGLGQILKGAVFTKGATPANPLFVADVTGGLGGGKVPVAPAAGAGALLTTVGVGTVVALAAGAAMTAYQMNADRFGKAGLTENEIRAYKWSQMTEEERAVSRKYGYGEQKDQAKLLASALDKLNRTVERLVPGKPGSPVLGPPKPTGQERLGAMAGNYLPQVPGFAGIIARATARGKVPTATAVSKTSERNQLRAAQAAERTAQETAALKRAQGIAATAQSILQSIGNSRMGEAARAARDTAAAVRGLNVAPVVSVTTGFNVSISVRDTQTRIVQSNTINTGNRTRRGASGRFVA